MYRNMCNEMHGDMNYVVYFGACRYTCHNNHLIIDMYTDMHNDTHNDMYTDIYNQHVVQLYVHRHVSAMSITTCVSHIHTDM